MRRITFSLLAALFAALLLPAAYAQQDVITTLVGGGPSGMPAIDANLNQPVAIALDSAGNYYIAAYNQQRVFKVSTAGTITVVAGSGISGYAGDGVSGGALNAYFSNPQAVVVDSSGNIYVSDTYNCVVRKIDSTNTITTVAGQAQQCGYNGEGPATTHMLAYPGQLALDSGNNLYIADSGNCRIRKVVGTTISTVAGNGNCGFAGDGGLAVNANLNTPNGLALDSAGDIFIADTYNYVVRKVAVSTGNISTIAGTHGQSGFAGDGGPATTGLMNYTTNLAVNSAGTSVWIADQNNFRIRNFTVGGNINTVAGDGQTYFCGDDGPAVQACLYYPQGVAVNSAGTIFIADTYNERIRQVSTAGTITTIAGNGSTTLATPANNVPALGAELYYPFGVFQDALSNVYIGDSSNQLVRNLTQSTGNLTFLAGTGIAGYTGDNLPATASELYNPNGVARDSLGNTYIADTYNCLIREVNTAGIITTFAGRIVNGVSTCGYGGDGGPAVGASLSYPYGVFVDSANNVWIADSSNGVIREVVNGTINTVVGIGLNGYSGDGGPGSAAMLYNPYGVATDAAGNIFIADTYNCRIREVNALTKTISTVAGNGACYFQGDGPATQVGLSYPASVAVDLNDNMFIADTNSSRLRWVDEGGSMTTFAGGGTNSGTGYIGDGGVATSALLAFPNQVVQDSTGNFLFSDSYNSRVRSITAFAAVNRSASSLTFGLQNVNTTSGSQYVKLSAVGPLNISSITVSGPFSESDNCGSMSNGQLCTMYVYFTPTASGTSIGTVTINDNGFFSPAQTIALTGTGTAMSVTPSTEAFGNVVVKAKSAVKSVTVKNNGSTGVTMGAITLIDTVDFSITSNTCPASGLILASKASCTVMLQFSPQSTGAKKGTLAVNDSDPATPQIVGLTGTGTSSVTFNPTSLTFGTTAIGATSASSSVTLTNKTGANLTLSTPALSTTGAFAVASTGTTCSNGLVIANNGTCVIKVTFKPTVIGLQTGTLSVADSDPTSPQSISLTGTGTALTFQPASTLNFGTVTRGQSLIATATLMNVSLVPVTISSASITGANSDDFLNYYNGNPPCGGSIAAGASCNLTFIFFPSIVGTEKATYSVFDNGGGSPQKLTLSGTGQ